MPEEIKNLNQKTFSDIVRCSGVNTAIIPLGSLEQHGNHLPFSTDTLIVEHISKIVARESNSLLLPPICYGVSFEHEPFFNVSINYNILLNFISDICVSLFKQGLTRLYLINGHHGNTGLLQYVGQHVFSKHDVKDKFFYFINYWQMLDKSFDHAGEVETSLMLFICPDLVRSDLYKKGLELDEKDGHFRKTGINMSINNPGGFIKFTKGGVWGNPAVSSPDKGKEMVSIITKKILLLLSDRSFK